MIQGDEILGSIELDSGKVFWLIARREPMSPEERDSIDPIPGKTKVYLSGKERRPKMFTAVTVIKTHPYPALIEIALGYENFSFPD